jgi:hypothetical protein
MPSALQRERCSTWLFVDCSILLVDRHQWLRCGCAGFLRGLGGARRPIVSVRCALLSAHQSYVASGLHRLVCSTAPCSKLLFCCCCFVCLTVVLFPKDVDGQRRDPW